MSTVHICLNDIFGVAVACEVIFYPGDTPFFNGAALAVSGARSIRLDAEGNGSVTLLPGRYAVRFSGITSNTDTLLILVPNEEGDYQLSELICGGNWVLPMRDFLQKSKNLSDVTDPATAFNTIKQAASPAMAGVVCLATQAEVDAGTDAAKCVTPATLANAAHSGKARFITVPNAAGRLALTPAQVGVGDSVEQADTRAVYQVLDTTLLDKEVGYVQIGTREALPPGALTAGLIAYWKMDEQSGVRADATGNGNDLTDNNSTGYTAGIIGNAASTDGEASYLSAPATLLDNAAAFSVSTWFQKIAGVDKSLPIYDGYGDQGKFGFLTYDIGDGNGVALHAIYQIGAGGEGGLPNWYWNSLDPLCILTNTTVPLVDGNWYHAVLTYDGTTVSLYVNGQLVATNPASGNLNAFHSTIIDGILFGNSNEGLPAETIVDETGLWERALSTAEITQLYNNGNGLTYPFA